MSNKLKTFIVTFLDIKTIIFLALVNLLIIIMNSGTKITLPTSKFLQFSHL